VLERVQQHVIQCIAKKSLVRIDRRPWGILVRNVGFVVA
jgi:hypothetical protein